MKIFSIACLVGVVLLSSLVAEESGFEAIFNGEDLTGWDGQPDAWEVRDHEIWCTGVAEDKNWLIWRESEPANFILKLEFKWEKGNSGVQVRSDDLGDWKIFGYQVEVAQQGVMGLWHHSLLDKSHPKKPERHLFATAGQTSFIDKNGKRYILEVNDPEKVKSAFRDDDWNEMEIHANGPVLVQKINGVVFSTLIDLDEEMSREKGFIALQDHGKGCRVAFRNLRIKLLE